MRRLLYRKGTVALRPIAGRIAVGRADRLGELDSANTNTVGDPGFRSAQNDDGDPETIARGERYLHVTSPVDASMAVNHPWDVPSRRYVPPR